MTDKNSNTNSNTLPLKAALTGVVVGAAAVLLSKKEVRDKISKTAKKMIDQSEKAINKAVDHTEEAKDKVVKETDSMAKKLQRAI